MMLAAPKKGQEPEAATTTLGGSEEVMLKDKGFVLHDGKIHNLLTKEVIVAANATGLFDIGVELPPCQRTLG
jgi:hypothetical protein